MRMWHKQSSDLIRDKNVHFFHGGALKGAFGLSWHEYPQHSVFLCYIQPLHSEAPRKLFTDTFISQVNEAKPLTLK